MRSTFKVLFYVKKGCEKRSGNLPLMCRITVDGEIKQFSCKSWRLTCIETRKRRTYTLRSSPSSRANASAGKGRSRQRSDIARS